MNQYWQTDKMLDGVGVGGGGGGGITCNGLAFHSGEVAALLAASYYSNWDKL